MNALWLRRGDVVEVTEGRRHIEAICLNPSRFGFSQESVVEAFDTEKEPIGLDGKAATYLETDLLRRGWLRVREMRNSVIVLANASRNLDNESLSYLRNRFRNNQLSFSCLSGEHWAEWQGRRIS